ncbi:HAD family hydrolase [Achlya hypogyna]|uniref:HAD family hydrolase n=1 Tax=Achlya hypogyna TaxID=1202772 RepID=A0A1V9Z4U8_ACHHY|nr:HAD family hydrolase [Achlya hypogyna]
MVAHSTAAESDSAQGDGSTQLVEMVATKVALSPKLRELITTMAEILGASPLPLTQKAQGLLSLVKREQALTNDTPVVPTSATSPIVYAMDQLLQRLARRALSPDTTWVLLMWPLSSRVPAEERLAMVQMILTHGCTVLVAILLTALRAVRSTTSNSSIELLEQLHATSQALLVAPAESPRAWAPDVSRSLPSCTQRSHARLDAYDYIGFDVDGTLVQYNTQRIFDEAMTSLHRRLLKVYPVLAAADFPRWLPQLAQRHVAIDVVAGNFVVLRADGSVAQAFHGSALLPTSPAVASPFVYMHTLQDVAFAPLFAWLVDAHDAGALVLPAAESTPYAALAATLRQIAYQYHAQDLEPAIMSAPRDYVPRARATQRALRRLGQCHRLFVLTNGTWEHANHVLSSALGSSWERHFAFVLTEARKETFFTPPATSPRPFVDALHHAPAPSPLPLLSGRQRYAGGHATLLQAVLGPTARVCYVGDHRIQDVELPRQCCGWDTIAVLEELRNVRCSRRSWWVNCRGAKTAPGMTAEVPTEVCFRHVH